VPNLLVPDNTKVAVIKACLCEPQVNRMTASRRWLLAGISRGDEVGLGAALEKMALIVLRLAMLLAECRPPHADAELGPYPGRRFQ